MSVSVKILLDGGGLNGALSQPIEVHRTRENGLHPVETTEYSAMQKTILSITRVVTAVGLLTGVAFAGHTEPAKAKARFALVNSYFRCDTPNTATQRPPGDETAACAPAVPENLCAFISTGSGALAVQPTGSVTQGNQDLKLSVVAQGLNAFCEGLPLCITLSYRATADDCPEGSCTTFDVQERSWLLRRCRRAVQDQDDAAHRRS